MYYEYTSISQKCFNMLGDAITLPPVHYVNMKKMTLHTTESKIIHLTGDSIFCQPYHWVSLFSWPHNDTSNTRTWGWKSPLDELTDHLVEKQLELLKHVEGNHIAMQKMLSLGFQFHLSLWCCPARYAFLSASPPIFHCVLTCNISLKPFPFALTFRVTKFLVCPVLRGFPEGRCDFQCKNLITLLPAHSPSNDTATYVSKMKNWDYHIWNAPNFSSPLLPRHTPVPITGTLGSQLNFPLYTGSPPHLYLTPFSCEFNISSSSPLLCK